MACESNPAEFLMRLHCAGARCCRRHHARSPPLAKIRPGGKVHPPAIKVASLHCGSTMLQGSSRTNAGRLEDCRLVTYQTAFALLCRRRSFAKRVFDLGLTVVVARFWIEGGSRSNNPLRASKLSCSAGDGSNTFGGEFPRGGFNDVDTPGEHFIAILHHVDDVHVAAPMTGSSKFSEAAVPLLNQLETGDNGGVAGIRAVDFKNPNDMVRGIAYVDIHPLCDFAVFRSGLK